jgi:hypothetical protein
LRPALKKIVGDTWSTTGYENGKHQVPVTSASTFDYVSDAASGGIDDTYKTKEQKNKTIHICMTVIVTTSRSHQITI